MNINKRLIAYLQSTYLMILRRFTLHITFQESVFKIKSEDIIDWFYDLAFYVFDLITLPEVYEHIISIFKSDYRLNSEEEKNSHVTFLVIL